MDRSDVFLSYRRADVDFTKKLYSALKETGRELWVDWEDIPPGVEGFSDEIQRGIEGTHTFICVLSPSYLESEYCLMELREALKLKKRVIPIVLKKFEPLPPPEGIGHINWVYFTPHAGQKNKFEESFPKVIEALEADYEYVREHTRLLLRAIDWDKGQRGKSYVLKDAEIEKAERWQVAAIAKNPTPTELHGEYILTSRTIQRQQQRRFTAIIGILLGFAVLAAIFAGFQWRSAVRSEATAVAAKNDALTQKAIADDQRATAQAAEATAVAAKEEAVQQRTIAEEQAQNALISGLAAQSQLTQSRQLGILLALESYNASLKKGEIQPAVQTSLRSSLAGFSGVPVQTHPSVARFAQFSPNDRWLIGSSDSGQVQINDLTQGLNSQPIILTDAGSNRYFGADPYDGKPILVFSPDSQWLAGIYVDNDTSKSGVRIWSLDDLKSGSQTLDLPEDAASPITIAFSTNEDKQYWLAAGLEDGSIYTWNVSDLPKAEATLFSKKDKFARSATKMVFSPDGNWLAVAFQPANPYFVDPSATSPSMLIWNMNNVAGEPIMVDLLQSSIFNLTFSGSGKWLAGFSSSQIDGLTKLRLWNMSTLTPTTTLANSLDTDTGGGIAFSPDDRWVAVIGGNSAEVWSLNNFSSTKLPGYKDIVLTVGFSPDGQWLATGDYDGQIRFWKTSDLANKPLVEAQARTYSSFDVIVNSLDFNSNGSQLVAAGDQQVRVWNFPVPLSDPIKSPYTNIYLTLGNFVLIQDSPDSVYVMDLGGDEPAVVVETTQKAPLSYFNSPDERYLAVTSEKQIQVWDLQNPVEPLFEDTRDSGRFTSPIFTQNSRWFVYAVYNQIFALDLQKPDAAIVLSGNRPSAPISAFYSIDHWLISQSSAEFLAWDASSSLSVPVKLSASATSVSVQIVEPTPKPKWLFGQQAGNVLAWDISDFSHELLVFEGTYQLLFQDRWLLTSTPENEAILWDISNPASPVVRTLNYGVSESQNWFSYYDDENTLWLLDLKSASPKPVKVGKFEGGGYPIFSANDQWLALIADDGTSTLIYDLTQNLSKFELSDVTPFNFSQDGRWLALQDAEQNMVLYDLQARQQLPVKYPNSYGFQQTSPDGRWAVGGLASNANTDMLLIDLHNPEKFYVLTGHTDSVVGRLFTPDQRWLLTYGFDGSVRIWDLENPADDPVILSHENLVGNVQLSKNDKWLLSSTDKNLYIWQWDFNSVHDLACRLVGRNLTQAEWNKYIGGTEYRKTCDQWP